MRALQALLAHPVVAKVERRVVAGRAGADHDHAAGLAHEARRRQRGLARVLEHDRRVLLLAERLPERRAERARALEPLRVLDVVRPARQLAPVIELAAIDHADRAELLAELVLAVARDDRDRAARPPARAIWIAIEPRPPAPPQIRTGSPGCTTFGGQPCSMRYAVAPTSMYAAASSHVRCSGLGTHWWSWTFVNCAKLPQFDS